MAPAPSSTATAAKAPSAAPSFKASAIPRQSSDVPSEHVSEGDEQPSPSAPPAPVEPEFEEIIFTSKRIGELPPDGQRLKRGSLVITPNTPNAAKPQTPMINWDHRPPEVKQVEDEEDAILAQIAKVENAAASVLQKAWRRQKMKRAMPEIRRLVLENVRQRRAATRMQAASRGFLQRTYKFRLFKRGVAIRKIQHASRRRARAHMRTQLLHGGFGLSGRSIERCLVARDAFILLTKPERTALLPLLLAMQNGPIEALHQAKELWASMPPQRRAHAITQHCHKADVLERKQIVRLVVRTLDAEMLLDLLEHVSDYASVWGLRRTELVQAFLARQPRQIAAMAENRIVDGLVDTLRPDEVTRSMQRMSLYAHMPQIRKTLPEPPKKPFERIPQFPDDPPRSARPLPAGVFGPRPDKDTHEKAFLRATQTVNPREPGQPQPLPVLSPRGLAEALSRELYHKSGGVQPQPRPPAEPRGFHGPPVPRAVKGDAAEASVRAARAAAAAVGGVPMRAFAKKAVAGMA